VVLLSFAAANAQTAPSIQAEIKKLRDLPDDVRARATKQLAIQIRSLPPAQRLGVAQSLANVSTEGDFGRDTLQEVTTTLAEALRGAGGSEDAYVTLAQLVRYEHMTATLDNPKFAAAFARLEADDRARQSADFTLSDLQGKRWNLRSQRGKVVLVNFWATWCPPCRKEIPDLEALYKQFASQGFVVLAISDEDAAKVQPFMKAQKVTYPVLLDPGRKINERFLIQGIPKSFVYDREGKLVAQSIDMRTRNQFLEMLAAAGLK
jgi:peroxiredoxin